MKQLGMLLIAVSPLPAARLSFPACSALTVTVKGIGNMATAATKGLLRNPRRHEGSPELGNNSKNYYLVHQLWISEGRPGIDPRVGEGAKPALSCSQSNTTCAESAKRIIWALPVGLPSHFDEPYNYVFRYVLYCAEM